MVSHYVWPGECDVLFPHKFNSQQFELGKSVLVLKIRCMNEVTRVKMKSQFVDIRSLSEDNVGSIKQFIHSF